MARLRRVTNVFEQAELCEEFTFLGSIADLVETEFPAGEWEVVLNGKVLTKDLWEVTYPRDVDVILVHPLISGGGDNDKATLRTVALIGVSIASMGVGSAISGSMLAGTTVGTTLTMGQTFVMIAGMTATNIIGGMLVNKLIPYPETKDKATKTHSAYGFSPVATQQQGLAIPMWYGDFKLRSGNVIQAYKENQTVSDTVSATYYDIIMSLGLGPWESIKTIDLPGAINSDKTQKEYRLGLLNQSVFADSKTYNITSHTVDLSVFDNHVKDTEYVGSKTISFIIPTTNIEKFDFDILFSSGAYSIWSDGQEGGNRIAVSAYVADSATLSGGDYTWQPVNPKNFPGNLAITGGISAHSTDPTRYWSYGCYSRYIIDLNLGNGGSSLLAGGSGSNLERTAESQFTTVQTVWVEVAQGAGSESSMPATPNLLSLYTWRYLPAYERIMQVGASTQLVADYNMFTHDVFSVNYSAEINTATTVASYVFKLVITRNFGTPNPAATNVTYEGSYWESNIATFNTYNNSVSINPLTYPRNVLARISALASENVKSITPEISFFGRKVAYWTGSEWAFGYKNNPAWVCYDILTQPLMPDGTIANWTTTSPALRYEGINPSQLDYVSFKAWADFCDDLVAANPTGTEKRYVFNGGFDETSSMWEAALAVAGMSQAWLVWHGSEIQVVLDHTTAVSSMFTTGNYITDSVKVSYLSLHDRATAVEVDYIAEGQNYSSNKFSLTESGFSDTQKKVSIQLRGCTSDSQAYRTAKFELLKNKHLKKTIEFQAPLNAVACTIGDVIAFQSSTGKYNWGGRIKEIVSPTVVVLDRSFIFDIAVTYTLRVMKEDGTIVTAALVALSGTTDTITLAESITVTALDTYAIGENTLVTETFRVLDVSQSTDLLCTLSCVQYVAEIYDYNDSDVISMVYTAIPDMPMVSIVGVNTSSYFDTNKKHRSIISFSITKPDSIYYKYSKVYYKETSQEDHEWVFAGILAESSFSLEVPLYSTEYVIAVATVNTQDITMNLLDAPQIAITSALAVLPAVSSLTATPQYLSTLATWRHQNNSSVSSYELWMSSTNDRTLATQVYGGVENNTIVQIDHSLIYYLWIKPIDSLGNSGAWFPTSPTAGIEATSDVLDLSLINEYNQVAPNPTSVTAATLS